MTWQGLVGRWQRASSDVAWPVLAVLFLASAAGFLYGVFIWFGSHIGIPGSRPSPRLLWEGLAHLAVGVAALLAFPAALWARTRTRPALVLLLAAAVFSVALLTWGTWLTATCAPLYCTPGKDDSSTPLFHWLRGLGD